MANLFRRISDIVTANINDMIDKVEDPERMIKQMIREMEDNVRRAEEGVIDALAYEKRLGLEMEQHRQQSGGWGHKAEIALGAGNEELARAALVRKKEYEAVAREVEVSWKAAGETSRNLKDQLFELEKKIVEVRRRRSALFARQRASEARRQMLVARNRLQKNPGTRDEFLRMEEQVLQLESDTEAVEQLELESSGEFFDQAVDIEVENELAKLKKKLEGYKNE